jgi:hypothetical protein
MAFAAGLDPKTSFRGIRIHFLDFGESDLTGFDFSGTDLTGCNFSRAKIDGAVFAGACLNKVRGMKKGKTEVFISYSSTDYGAARLVADGLQSRNVLYFLSRFSFYTHTGMRNIINEEEEQINCLIFIISEKSLKYYYKIKNIENFIVKNNKKNLMIFTVLVDITTYELPEFLRKVISIDLVDLEVSLDRIAEMVNQ